MHKKKHKIFDLMFFLFYNNNKICGDIMKEEYGFIFSEFIRSLGGWDRFNKVIRGEHKELLSSVIYVNEEDFLTIFSRNNAEVLINFLSEQQNDTYIYSNIEGLKSDLINFMKNKYNEDPLIFEQLKLDNEYTDPLLEGITHLNVYTKSKFKIGRALSNMSNFPVLLKEGKFNTLEGYWYWRMTGRTEYFFKFCSGYEAKKKGQQILKNRERAVEEDNEDFREDFKLALRERFKQNKDLLLDLVKTNLPLKHYYFHQGTKNVLSFKIIDKSAHDWTLKEIERVREACHKKLFDNGKLGNFPAKIEELKLINNLKFR